LELLAFNAPKNYGVTLPCPRPLFGNIWQGHVGTLPGNRPANFEVRTFSRFRTIALNAQKITGSRDRDHAHFLERFVSVMSGLSLETRLPNLKFVSSAVLELSASNAQKICGVTWPWPRPLFGNICQGSCRDCPWEHACLIWSSYLQPFSSRQTDRQTGTGLSEGQLG